MQRTRRALGVLLPWVLTLVPLRGVPAQNDEQAATPAAPASLRVVVQVSEADPARWNLVLNNVRNLQEEVGAANVQLELVAFGPGLGILKADSPVAGRVADAIAAGIAMRACENTMRAQKVTRAEIAPGVGYVPAGVVEIVRRQQQGWAYLRP